MYSAQVNIILKGPSPVREKNNISHILASWTPNPCSKLLFSLISASNQLLKLNSSCYTPPEKRQCVQIVSPKKCQCVQIVGFKKRRCVQIVGFKKRQYVQMMGKQLQSGHIDIFWTPRSGHIDVFWTPQSGHIDAFWETQSGHIDVFWAVYLSLIHISEPTRPY